MKITIHNINDELKRLVDNGLATDKATNWFRQQLAIIILDESISAYERQAAAIALITFDEDSRKN
jgi:hypothetical protein